MNFLPLGTVVTLKNIDRTIMINGYLPNVVGKEINTFDYVGIIFPEGNLINGNTLYFNDDSIDKVLFRGYENESFNAFINRFNTDVETVETLENNEPLPDITYEFDDNGTVVGVGAETITSPTIPDDMAKTVYIFDDNGTVIDVQTVGEDQNKENSSQQYQFDENGIVIGVIDNNQETNTSTNEDYEFDENGNVINVNIEESNNDNNENPGYVFDSEGNVVSIEEKKDYTEMFDVNEY